MRILTLALVLIFGGFSALQAEGLPCVVAATEPNGVVVLMPGEGLCPGRAPGFDNTGANWHRVGLLLQKEQVVWGDNLVPRAIIEPGNPQPTTKWVDVEFREAKLMIGSSGLKRQEPWVGLTAGAYRVIVSVFDDDGHDYLSALRFNVSPLQARDEPYLRAGWTEMPDLNTFRFGSLIGNRTATGFLFQEITQFVFEGSPEKGTISTAVVAGAEFAEVGKLGDVRLIQAGLTFRRWGLEAFSPNHPITACVQPDGLAETFCGDVYTPGFPNRGDWRATK